MLLGELVKHTWEDHIDYSNLVKAQMEMEKVATYVNEVILGLIHIDHMKKKREFENTNKVREFQRLLDGKHQVGQKVIFAN